MPKEIEEKLVRMRDEFLWEGKKPRVAHRTMGLPIDDGGKQILDIQSRNEAIDLWNLKEFLKQGDDRANWPFFVEYTISNRWNASQSLGNQGAMYSPFLQHIHIPQWRNNPLAYDIGRMIKATNKYRLEFTVLSISKDIQLQMPVWNHIALIGPKFEKIQRKEAVKCLRHNHNTRSVADILKIAERKTTVIRQPHSINPSGIGRKNCGCQLWRRDRLEFGCSNPGQCVEAAKALLDCIYPKWSPLIANNDLCDNLKLSEIEESSNSHGREDEDALLTFDPDFRLSHLSCGFRIFALEDHTTELPTKRYNMPNPNSIALDVYLHAKIFHPREEHAQMHAMLLVQAKPTANAHSEVKMRESLIVSFPDTKVDPSFNTALLAGLFHALRELPQDTTLTVHCCSNLLGKVLVTDRTNYENNLLGPHYQLIKCVVSALQERSGKVYLKKVDTNPAVGLQNLNPTPTTVDTQSDIMFCTPGILLMERSQRSFTKIIKSMREKPTRKSTTINLDRIRCCIEEAFQYRPNDSAIWTSIRSNNIHRLTRNFLWRSGCTFIRPQDKEPISAIPQDREVI
ncbi:hypothetical protein B0H13DRAFT_1891329 [Mycena leptocephala]|nr:hypothetical protein B0H13DRAFT_1891329 [Mycena leptocephala]